MLRSAWLVMHSRLVVYAWLVVLLLTDIIILIVNCKKYVVSMVMTEHNMHLICRVLVKLYKFTLA